MNAAYCSPVLPSTYLLDSIRLYRSGSASGSPTLTLTVNWPPAGTLVSGVTAMPVITGGVSVWTVPPKSLATS